MIESIYKKGLQNKVRFYGSKVVSGKLTTEQLWDLEETDLDDMYGTMSAVLEHAGKKSLLKKKNLKDAILELKIAIVEDVLKTKIAEREARENALITQQEKTQERAELDALIAEKKGDEKRKLSLEELEALREKL